MKPAKTESKSEEKIRCRIEALKAQLRQRKLQKKERKKRSLLRIFERSGLLTAAQERPEIEEMVRAAVRDALAKKAAEQQPADQAQG